MVQPQGQKDLFRLLRRGLPAAGLRAGAERPYALADEIRSRAGGQLRIGGVVNVVIVKLIVVEQLIFVLIVVEQLIVIIVKLFELERGGLSRKDFFMPADLPSEIVEESRKLETKSAWLWLLDVTITGVEETLRLVNNTENIPYGGNTYTRCSFTLGPWRYTETGELPTRELKVTNIDIVNYMLPYVRAYSGAIGSTVVTTPVNSLHLDVDMSGKAMEFMVLASSPSEQWIVFQLGAPNPLIQRVPRHKYFADYCCVVADFKKTECGYAGAEIICNGTLKQCRQYGNQTRFGGEPGLRNKTVKFAW